MKDFLKKRTANERGATSVLIIFMMLILVTLGAFTITSANMNFKFSTRALNWNVMYYSLDAKGEEYLAALDGKLAEAEAMACDYMESKSYRTADHSEIPEQMQSEIYNQYREDNLISSDAEDIFNKVYMYYADTLVNDLTLAYSDLQVYSIEDGSFIDGILTTRNIKSERPGDELCGLNISVWVEPMECQAAEINGSLSVTRASGFLRYKIEDWYEYQEPISEEEPGEELWDGTVVQ